MHFTFTESELRLILEDAINLFREYREDWDYDDEAAEVEAVNDTVEGLRIRMDVIQLRQRVCGEEPHSTLSSLTLEDVERACEAAFKALPSTTDPSHFAAIRAYWLDVMDRLRQQVNGDTCTREEG